MPSRSSARSRSTASSSAPAMLAGVATMTESYSSLPLISMAKRRRIEPRSDGIDHLLHAVFERAEQRPRRLLARHGTHLVVRSQHGPAQAAVLLFHFHESR